MPEAEYFDFRRVDELRELAPHLTYRGLQRWFESLPLHAPKVRRTANKLGEAYHVGVKYRRSVMHRTITVMFSSLIENSPEVAIRGREVVPELSDTGELFDFADYLIEGLPPEWRRRDYTLDLIVPDSALATLRDPPIVTIQSVNRLPIAQAEAILLGFTLADPLISSAPPVPEA